MKRWLSPSAALGGLTYILLNLIIEAWFPDHWAGSPARWLGLSYAGWSRLLWIPEALFILGLTGIFRHLAQSIGKLGKAAYWLALVGFGLTILGIIIEFWIYGLILVPFSGEFYTGSAGSQMGYEMASIGSMIAILGLILFGFASLRAPLARRWRVLPLLLSLIALSIFYFYFTEYFFIYIMLYGSIWVVIGIFLWKDQTDDL